MKKIILLFPIILLLGIFTTNAQEENYHPLVQEGKMWSVLDAIYVFNPGDGPAWYTYTTQKFMFYGDTVINEKEYKKMYISLKENPIFPHDWSLHSFMREDENKKVWQLKSSYWGDLWEELLYDFSLEIGDTVQSAANCYVIVEDIADEIMHNGDVRKVFRFSKNCFYEDDDYSFIMEDYWVEGIGSNYGLLIPFGSELTGGFYELLCFHENDGLIFFNEEYKTCYKSSVGINTYDNRINIFPNPTTNVFNIENIDNLNIRAISIFNIQGQMIRQYDINSTQLDVSNISSGLYFIKIFTSGGECIVKKVIIDK